MILTGSVLALGGLVATPRAVAASSSTTGTASLVVTSSSAGLSVSSAGSSSLSGQMGAASSGTLGTADWADPTGSGLGWNGTVAVTPLIDSGAWVAATSSDPLASSAAGNYSGTLDGVYYTVNVTGGTTGSNVTFSYTSNYTGDASGNGSAASDGTASVGGHGVTIAFSPSGTYKSGDSYTVQVGQQSGGMTFSGSGATIGAVNVPTLSVAPVYDAASTGATITGTSGVKFLEAAVGTGGTGTSGYYTAAPGVSFTPDANSWAGTYTGTVTYSIVQGP